MNAKTRYDIKVGWSLFPAGTIVKIVAPEHPFLQDNFPGLKFKDGSTYVAVRFPAWPNPTIVDRSQLVLPEWQAEPAGSFAQGAMSAVGMTGCCVVAEVTEFCTTGTVLPVFVDRPARDARLADLEAENNRLKEAIATFLVPHRFSLAECWLKHFVDVGAVVFDKLGFVKPNLTPNQ